MIDVDQQADFEAWRERKIVGQVDISVAAYNIEMESQAVAWEEGLAHGALGRSRAEVDLLMLDNPYRKAGMTGERPRHDAITVPRQQQVSETATPSGSE